MILDRLENAGFYRSLGAEIAMALDYLRRTDFSQIPDGRHELDGDRVFAIVQRYRPKPLTEAQWEAHRQYIDVQYVAAGAERMGYAPPANGSVVRRAYNSQDDYVLCDAEGDFFAVRAGSFAIFTPHDTHASGMAIDPPEVSTEVCKVVVKCRVAENKDTGRTDFLIRPVRSKAGGRTGKSVLRADHLLRAAYARRGRWSGRSAAAMLDELARARQCRARAHGRRRARLPARRSPSWWQQTCRSRRPGSYAGQDAGVAIQPAGQIDGQLRRRGRVELIDHVIQRRPRFAPAPVPNRASTIQAAPSNSFSSRANRGRRQKPRSARPSWRGYQNWPPRRLSARPARPKAARGPHGRGDRDGGRSQSRRRHCCPCRSRSPPGRRCPAGRARRPRPVRRSPSAPAREKPNSCWAS